MVEAAIQPKFDWNRDALHGPLEIFIAEAMARAEAAGYFPAQYQREVDWETARYWALVSSKQDFCWADADDRSVGAIIVGPGPDGMRAIHSGQHRILGGLMSGNPVPMSSITWLSVPDPARPWLASVPEIDIFTLLG